MTTPDGRHLATLSHKSGWYKVAPLMIELENGQDPVKVSIKAHWSSKIDLDVFFTNTATEDRRDFLKLEVRPTNRHNQEAPITLEGREVGRIVRNELGLGKMLVGKQRIKTTTVTVEAGVDAALVGHLTRVSQRR